MSLASNIDPCDSRFPHFNDPVPQLTVTEETEKDLEELQMYCSSAERVSLESRGSGIPWAALEANIQKGEDPEEEKVDEESSGRHCSPESDHGGSRTWSRTCSHSACDCGGYRASSKDKVINFEEVCDNGTSEQYSTTSEYETSGSDVSLSLSDEDDTPHSSVWSLDAKTRSTIRKKINLSEIIKKHKLTRACKEDLKTYFMMHDSDHAGAGDVLKSSYQEDKFLLEASGGLRGQKIDMCPNYCVLYYEENENLLQCPECNTLRKKHCYLTYYSIEKRLDQMVQEQKDAMRYRHRYSGEKGIIINPHMEPEVYEDVFDGERYRELVGKGCFKHESDIALALSHDGFVFFKARRNNAWIVLVLNLNLPPDQRVKVKNLIPVLVIPGHPPDLNRFIVPVLKEIKTLETATSRRPYRAFLLFICSDLMAANILNGYKIGANAYCACRFCTLLGFPLVKKSKAPGPVVVDGQTSTSRAAIVTESGLGPAKSRKRKRPATEIGTSNEEITRGHYYYPLSRPNNYPPDFVDHPQGGYEDIKKAFPNGTGFFVPKRELRYDIDNIIMRTHHDYCKQTEFVRSISSKAKRVRVSQVLGVTHSTEELPLFKYIPNTMENPYITPIDTMHLVENIGKIFIGEIYPKLKDPATGDRVLSDSWISKIKHYLDNCCVIPSRWGRPPRSSCFQIDKIESYKATEWLNFILYLSPGLFEEALPRKYYEGWMNMVRIFRIGVRRKITKSMRREIKSCIKNFFRHFERDIYQGKAEHLVYCTLNIHYLCHYGLNIRQFGPAWTCWQYFCERFIGIIVQLIRSPKKPSISLMNEVLRKEQLIHAQHRNEVASIDTLTSMRLQAALFERFEFGFAPGLGKNNKFPLYLSSENVEAFEYLGYFSYPRRPWKKFEKMFEKVGTTMRYFETCLARFFYAEDEESESADVMLLPGYVAAFRSNFQKEDILFWGKYYAKQRCIADSLGGGDDADKLIFFDNEFVLCSSIFSESSRVEEVDPSRPSKHTRSNKRNSSLVAVKLLSPEGHPGEYIDYYGQILFYFSYYRNYETKMLALIRWVDDEALGSSLTRVGRIPFYSAAGPSRSHNVDDLELAGRKLQVIKAESIRRSVAVLKRDGVNLVIDRDLPPGVEED